MSVIKSFISLWRMNRATVRGRLAPVVEVRSLHSDLFLAERLSVSQPPVDGVEFRLGRHVDEEVVVRASPGQQLGLEPGVVKSATEENVLIGREIMCLANQMPRRIMATAGVYKTYLPGIEVEYSGLYNSVEKREIDF